MFIHLKYLKWFIEFFRNKFSENFLLSIFLRFVIGRLATNEVAESCGSLLLCYYIRSVMTATVEKCMGSALRPNVGHRFPAVRCRDERRLTKYTKKRRLSHWSNRAINRSTFSAILQADDGHLDSIAISNVFYQFMAFERWKSSDLSGNNSEMIDLIQLNIIQSKCLLFFYHLKSCKLHLIIGEIFIDF